MKNTRENMRNARDRRSTQFVCRWVLLLTARLVFAGTGSSQAQRKRSKGCTLCSRSLAHCFSLNQVAERRERERERERACMQTCRRWWQRNLLFLFSSLNRRSKRKTFSRLLLLSSLSLSCPFSFPSYSSRVRNTRHSAVFKRQREKDSLHAVQGRHLESGRQGRATSERKSSATVAGSERRGHVSSLLSFLLCSPLQLNCGPG